ncbi:MAG: hypothetical protein IKH56_03925 [Oscillospiraceae bacterium]|nr:hypothetical protein [Oscillospiraceae bacterium]
MALISCPECGKQVSTMAEACPNCGYPIIKMTRENQDLGKSNEAIKKETTDTDDISMIIEGDVSGAINPMNKKKKLVALLATVLVVLAALVVVLVMVLNNRLTPEEQKQVSSVTAKIEKIGSVTVSDERLIREAQQAYDQLDDLCKRKVSNYKVLEDDIIELNRLKAETVSKTIEGIGKVDAFSEKAITTARKNYESLNEDQKTLITNYDVLIAAEESFKRLAVDECIAAIDDIGTVTIESISQISNATRIYNELSEEQKAMVTNSSILADADKRFTEISVNNAITSINKIGSVTLESEAVIAEAEDAYKHVLNKDKELVKNYETLEKAKKELASLKKEEAEKAMTLLSGDVIANNTWEATYKGVELTSKLLPDNIAGGYVYYHCDDNQVYVDILFTLKNNSSYSANLQNVVNKVQVIYNKTYNYTKYDLFYSKGRDISQVYDWDELVALDYATFHVAVPIPAEAQSNEAPIKVTITMLGQEKIVVVR